MSNNLNIRNIVFLTVLSFIVLGGFLLRVYSVGDQSLWIDEIYTINAGKALAEHGYPLLDSGTVYVNNFVSVYLSGLFIKLFTFDPFNPWLWRLPAVIFGTVLILAVYLFTRQLFNKRIVSLSSAFIVAFSYHEIAFSRQVRGYAALALFIVLCLYFLFKYFESRNKKDAFFSTVMFLFACLSHWVALAFVVPIIFISWIKIRHAQYFPTLSKDHIALIGIVILVFLTPLVMTLYQSGAVVVRYFLFPTLPFIAILISLVCKKLSDLLFKQRGLVNQCVFLILVVFSSIQFLVFYPKTQYQLSSASPQPDYASVFTLIKKIKSGDDLVITVRPVLQDIFLGENGMWVSRSMDGRDIVDIYTGIPALKTYEELLRFIEGKNGYLVSDGYVFEENFRKKNKFGTFKLFYSSGERVVDKIWLYTF